jgi:hypothetical protein
MPWKIKSGRKEWKALWWGEWQWGIAMLASTYTPLEANDQ